MLYTSFIYFLPFIRKYIRAAFLRIWALNSNSFTTDKISDFVFQDVERICGQIAAAAMRAPIET